MNIHIIKVVKKNTQNLFVAILTLSILLSCGAKIEKNEDTVRLEAGNYYIKGKRAFQADSLRRAEENFHRSLQVNPLFAPAYEGLALVDLHRNDYDKAEKLFNRALSLDVNWIPAEIGLLQIKVKRKEYNAAVWESERLNKKLYSSAYNDIVKKNLTNEINYWGRLAKQGLQTVEIEKLGGWQSVSDIAKEDTVRRAEFTAALVDVFSEPIYHVKAVIPTPAEDISENTLYHEQIGIAMKYGLVEPYPDNLFRPRHALKRAEAALILYNFIKLIGRLTEKASDPCKIIDIDIQSPIFNPICSIVNSEIMTCTEKGAFNPHRTLSGGDVLRILVRVKNYIDSEF